MNVVAPFGFVTGCHLRDRFMVQATLASIRYYCPEVPICLVADGVFDVSDLVAEYNVSVLRIPDLPSAEMRQLIAGNHRAKLAAMWEGPFEFYVWLDSDAIVWGDFTSQVRTDVDFQIFWDDTPIGPEEVPEWLRHFYFNLDALREFDPDFRWQGFNYFCSGAFASRREAIPFRDWLNVEDWNQRTPGLFAWGEMGMLNYLVHAKAQRQEIRVASADLQHVWAHHGKRELQQDCARADWRFPAVVHRPRVAHFCYRKPLLHLLDGYHKPCTIARLEHHRRHHGDLGAWLAVLNEDRRVLNNKVKRRLWNLVGR